MLFQVRLLAISLRNIHATNLHLWFSKSREPPVSQNTMKTAKWRGQPSTGILRSPKMQMGWIRRARKRLPEWEEYRGLNGSRMLEIRRAIQDEGNHCVRLNHEIDIRSSGLEVPETRNLKPCAFTYPGSTADTRMPVEHYGRRSANEDAAGVGFEAMVETMGEAKHTICPSDFAVFTACMACWINLSCSVASCG